MTPALKQAIVGVMENRMRVLAASGLVSLGAFLAQGTAAATTPPQAHHFEISLPGIDVCGFPMDSVVQGADTFRMVVDRSGNVSFQDTSHVLSTLTDEASGKVVYVEGSARDAWQEDPVVRPDGTITATDTLTGSPERVYTDHSDVLVKDVGLVSIVDSFDSDGNVIGEQVIVHGVHQVSGPDAAFCAAITAAIG